MKLHDHDNDPYALSSLSGKFVDALNFHLPNNGNCNCFKMLSDGEQPGRAGGGRETSRDDGR